MGNLGQWERVRGANFDIFAHFGIPAIGSGPAAWAARGFRHIDAAVC